MTVSGYTIRENYRDDDFMREAFFDFTRAIFPSVDFREWYARGFWPDEYIPHSIVAGDRIVANLSVTRMKLLVNERSVNGIQIGTVGTLPEYRGQGFSRLLMEHVLDEYDMRTELFFLYANDAVLDFYPRFGFELRRESLFQRESGIPPAQYAARILDIAKPADCEVIERLLETRMPLTGLFGAEGYSAITWWHILNIFPRNLYYLADEDVMVIFTTAGDRLDIRDVVCARAIDWGAVLPKIIPGRQIKSVVYHFPPDRLHFEYDTVEPEIDSPFFVRGAFPLAGKAFKLPVTAQT